MTDILPAKSQLVDQFSRTISYLRLSLTDRCNLRCLYCMPKDLGEDKTPIKHGIFLDHKELLTYEELLRVVGLTVSLGMNKLRLTGGEPLVRKGVLDFIHKLVRIDGLEQVRLTTNGVLLGEYASRLMAEGVKRINVSLDTLQPEKFKRITGRDLFAKVWDGLMVAIRLGFIIKVNVVAMKGLNDDEFESFAQMALHHPIQVRFIEFMPVGSNTSWQREHYISASQIEQRLQEIARLEPLTHDRKEGPARMFSLEDGRGRRGRIGFISPISHHFCGQCNRLRLTSAGTLRACLLNDAETDLKALIRSGASDEALVAGIRQTILSKPQGHSLQTELNDAGDNGACRTTMSRIGG